MKSARLVWLIELAELIKLIAQPEKSIGQSAEGIAKKKRR
jgi:hypothetical protein